MSSHDNIFEHKRSLSVTVDLGNDDRLVSQVGPKVTQSTLKAAPRQRERVAQARCGLKLVTHQDD